MVARAATLEVRVTGDASGASRAMDQVDGGASRFQSGMSKAAKVAAIGGAALVAFGKQAFDAASEAQQAAGAVDAVFGKSATAVHKFAKGSADATGLASSEYESMAATFGAQLKNMGVSSKKLAPTTDDLITMGADLAAQFGGSTSDAVAALSSLLRGETDPIERYGVSIKSADVEAQKAAMGLDNLTGKADKQATTQATLALLTNQTADAQGAFAREAGTAAGQQARANAKFKDATAALGTALLPVVSMVAGWLSKLAGFVQQNASVFQILIPILGGAAIAIWAVNAALAANPFTLIALGIAAVIAGIVLLVKNWDKVVAVFKKFWNWLKQNWDLLAVIILGPFGVAVMAIKRNWSKVTAVFRAFRGFVSRVFRSVRDVAVNVFRAVRDVILRTIDAAKRVVDWVKSRFVGAFRTARDVVRTVFSAIREAITRTIDAIVRVVTAVRDRLLGAFRTARDVIRTVMSAIREAITRVIDAIVRVVGAIRDRLGGAFRAVRDVAKNVFGAVRDVLQTVIDTANRVVNFFRETFASVFRTVQDVAVTAFNAMKAPIDAIADAIGWVIEKVESLIGWLGRIKVPDVGGLLGKLNPFSASAPSGSFQPVVARVAAPAVPMGRAGFGTVGSVGSVARLGSGVTINVNGALDPDAVARQIERILKARSRRTRGVVTARPLV